MHPTDVSPVLLPIAAERTCSVDTDVRRAAIVVLPAEPAIFATAIEIKIVPIAVVGADGRPVRLTARAAVLPACRTEGQATVDGISAETLVRPLLFQTDGVAATMAILKATEPAAAIHAAHLLSGPIFVAEHVEAASLTVAINRPRA